MMTYRDLFKVLEHFNLLDTNINNLEECQACNGDTLFVLTYMDMPEFSKDICINVSTGEITLTDMEVDPESELGDMMPTFEKKMSLKDIRADQILLRLDGIAIGMLIILLNYIIFKNVC